MAEKLTYDQLKTKYDYLLGATVGGSRVISILPERGANNRAVFSCICSCGREFQRVSTHVVIAHKYDRRIHCGCLGQTATKSMEADFSESTGHGNDITGLRVGMLTATRYVSSRKTKGGWIIDFWECQCDCGKTRILSKKTLQCPSAVVPSCGCERQWRAGAPEKPGNRFGSLTLQTRVTGRAKNAVWNCLCDCGEERVVVQNFLRNGTVTACVRCSRGILNTYGDIPVSHWDNIRSCARKRSLEFGITAKYIWGLFQLQGGKCAISGLPLSISSPITASLDRIDSKLGYLPDNVQWVHRDVNFMKSDHIQAEFIALCTTIADYQRSKAAAKVA